MFTGLAEPDYKETLNYADGTNSDIITTVEKNFPKAVQQTKEFAKRFKGSNARETAYNVWKFEKDHIHYSKDDSDRQLVRLPSRFIHDAAGDCKSYALTAAALLHNLGLPVAFRYASYNRFNPIPSHVYVVTQDEKGKPIIVDAVWKHFDSQKKPSHIIDHPMKVYTLSGIGGGRGVINGIAGKKKKKKGGLLKRIGKKLKKVQVGKGLKKIGLAPARRAYRTMLSINAGGLAQKMKRVYDRDQAALKAKWKKLGGDWASLQKSLKKGYNHYAKRHHKPGMAGVQDDLARQTMKRECAIMLHKSNAKKWHPHHRRLFRKKMIGCCAGINGIHGLAGDESVGAAVAVVLAAAAPIIAALAPLLKKHEGAEGSDSSTGETPIENIINQAKEAAAAYNDATASNPNAPATEFTDPTSPENANKVETEEGESDEPHTSFKPSLPLLAAAAAAVYFIFK